MKKLFVLLLVCLNPLIRATFITVSNESDHDIHVQLQLQEREGRQPKEVRLNSGEKVRLNSGFNRILYLDWSYPKTSDNSFEIIKWRGQVQIPQFLPFKAITITNDGHFLEGKSSRQALRL